MQEAIADTDLGRDSDQYSTYDREFLIGQIVDLFYRCKKTTSKMLKFEQFTSYLIEHEIDVVENAPTADMRYVEDPTIRDKTTHNNNIEKIYYFA